MRTNDLPWSSLVDIARLIRTSEVPSVQVTQVMLDRIAALDPVYKSYLHVCGERALVQAQAADAAIARDIWRGPLHGVPIAIKDLCYTTYAPTTAGTTLFANWIAPFNATVVERLEAAGAVVLGKLSMTEGAYTSHHPRIPYPPNPWNKNHWVGSSSTGSGVATATALCYGAIGSDTGGSIRFPAATCGLTGIKPTWGRVSRHGVFALADSLDHVGPMARSAADAGAMLGAIAGWDANDPTSIDAPVPDYLAEAGRSVRDLRIGIDRSYAFAGIDAEVAAALEQAIHALQSLGARFVEVTFPPYEQLVAHWIMMCSVETALAHEATYPARAVEYGPELVQLIEQGRRTKGLELGRGMYERLRFTEALATMLRAVDCLLIPTMPMPTPSLDRMAEYGADPTVLNSILRFTAPFDFAGNPTITLPNGIDAAGMPLSMQVVGPRLSEAVLVRVGHAFQTVTDWHRRHPI